jgi:hypothetical protein
MDQEVGVCVCNRFLKIGKTGYLVHLDGDTWCDPKQYQLSWSYKTAQLGKEENAR